MSFDIRPDDLSGPEIRGLLRAHLENMKTISPVESVHAIDIDAMAGANVTFWSAWDGGELLGCGALKELDSTHGEIKAMRTAPAHLRKGVGRAILEHLLAEAKRRGYARASLETGSQPPFEPARQMYAGFGFTPCGPFADYVEDPNSVFMTRGL